MYDECPLHELRLKQLLFCSTAAEMTGRLALFVLCVGTALVACSRFPLRRYNYVNIMMKWSEARLYCRQHHSDLATFQSMEEIQQLQPDFSYSWAWIGLYDDTAAWRGVMGNESNSWRWSATGETSSSGFQRWRQGEPQYGIHDETCVLMDGDGDWRDLPCSWLYGFICFTESDSGQRSYHYVSSSSSWADAQTHCRQHHTDLTVIESSEQNSDAFNAKPTSASAWIGLHRVPWAWSDRSLSSFRNWQHGSPNYPYSQHCVAESNGNHVWDDDDCEAQYGAWCHTDLTLQTFVQVTMESTADLTPPLTNAHILQEVEAALRSQGYTGVKLTWRMQRVQQKTQPSPRPQCHNF